jgi:hypothetical protein
MSVYVDPLFKAVSRDSQARRVGARNGHLWCHMTADTEEDLDAMAVKIGMKLAWKQHPGNPRRVHYDLTPSRRALAVKAGAVEETAQERLERFKRKGGA